MLQRVGLTVILLVTCALCLKVVAGGATGTRGAAAESTIDRSMIVAQSAPATHSVH